VYVPFTNLLFVNHNTVVYTICEVFHIPLSFSREGHVCLFRLIKYCGSSTERSIKNSTTTMTVFLSFAYKNIKRQTNDLIFSLYWLGTTYKTAFQPMLKMSITFSKTSIHPFLVCFVRLCEVFLGQCWKQSVQYRVSVPPRFGGLSNKPFFFRNPHRKKSGEVRYGDRSDQRPRSAMRSPKNSCRKQLCFSSVA
jgi:hypothetical protein